MKSFAFSTIFILHLAFVSFAQDVKTGGVTGKVKLVNGETITNVTVEARQENKVIAATQTDARGNFTINNLKPGVYKFVFNKKGLSEGTSTGVNIKAGTKLTLKKLIMTVDEGALAIIRGSVFDSSGRSMSGVKAEVFKIANDNSRKINEAFTSQSGEFVFRLPPDAAQYRFLVTADNAEPVSKNFDVKEGAQIYYLSITLKGKQ
jgi:5-hydroxyisourate hydrolase-like protein (transthyretin family)